MYREDILANRIKWGEFLCEPERKGYKGELENLDNPEERCCLGHACHLFTPDSREVHGEFIYYAEYNYLVAPKPVEELLGLYRDNGEVSRRNGGAMGYSSLASANDGGKTPQEIGAYILSCVEGGVDTPFKPLSDYPRKEDL